MNRWTMRRNLLIFVPLVLIALAWIPARDLTRYIDAAPAHITVSDCHRTGGDYSPKSSVCDATWTYADGHRGSGTFTANAYTTDGELDGWASRSHATDERWRWLRWPVAYTALIVLGAGLAVVAWRTHRRHQRAFLGE